MLSRQTGTCNIRRVETQSSHYFYYTGCDNQIKKIETWLQHFGIVRKVERVGDWHMLAIFDDTVEGDHTAWIVRPADLIVIDPDFGIEIVNVNKFKHKYEVQ